MQDRHGECDPPGLQFPVGFDERRIADALAGGDALHMNGRTDVDVRIACCLQHRGLNIIDRLLPAVHHLEDDLSDLIAREHTVLVVVHKAGIQDLDVGRIAVTSGQILHTRLRRGLCLGLGGTVITGIVAALEVIDTVVAGVRRIKSAAVTPAGQGVVVRLTVIIPPRTAPLHTGLALPHFLIAVVYLILRTLVGLCSCRSTDNGTARHADNRPDVRTACAARNTADSTSEDTS